MWGVDLPLRDRRSNHLALTHPIVLALYRLCHEGTTGVLEPPTSLGPASTSPERICQTRLDGATLRTLRLGPGRTQAAVAVAAGAPASVLSADERGRRRSSLAMADRVIDELGYRVEVVPRPDPAAQARQLEDVLALAEQLPYRPRPMFTARR